MLPRITVALGCLTGVASQGPAISSVPLFLWSEQPYFGTQSSSHVECSDVFHLPQFSSIFEKFATSTPSTATKEAETPEEEGVAKYFTNHESPPEVVIAFVHSKLSSAEAARFAGAYTTASAASALPLKEESSAGFSYVQQAFATAKSSLAVPYVLSSSDTESSLSLSDQLIASLSRVAPKAQVVAFQLGAETSGSEGSVAGCDALLAHAQEEGATMFNNGIPDLLLVKTDNNEDMKDECLQRVTEYINEKTKGRFVSLLTADGSTNPIQLAFPDPADTGLLTLGNKPRHFHTLKASTVKAVLGPQYITAPIISGLIIFFLIISITLCGVCCLMSVETPVRFTDTPLSIGKEY